jgi:predicted RNA-binding protein (virulence factor B family)
MSRAEKTTEDEKAIQEWLKNNEVNVCTPHEKTAPEDIEYTFKVGKRGRPAK